jgi:hypothetical protein
MVGDPQDAPIDFILEALAETGTNLLIFGDRIEKLALSLINEPDRHGANRRSASRMTSS